MDFATDEQRRAIWVQWGDRVNGHLQAIDGWFGAHGHLIPEEQAAPLRTMMRDLSAAISECPGKPEPTPAAGGPIPVYAYDPTHPEGAPIYDPVYASPELTRLLDRRKAEMDGLAGRAEARRKYHAGDVWVIAAVLVAGCFAVGWWLAEYLRGS